MKRCSSCKELKPVTEFHKNSRHKDGLQNYCKSCNRKAVIKHIHTHEGHNYQVRKDRHQELRKRAQEYKRSRGCHFCSENEPAVLDFHHLDSSTKTDQPSNLIKYSWERFIEEVSKCILLCANCHRKVHLGKLVLPGIAQSD